MKATAGKFPTRCEGIKWIYGANSMFADLTRFADRNSSAQIYGGNRFPREWVF